MISRTCRTHLALNFELNFSSRYQESAHALNCQEERSFQHWTEITASQLLKLMILAMSVGHMIAVNNGRIYPWSMPWTSRENLGKSNHCYKKLPSSSRFCLRTKRSYTAVVPHFPSDHPLMYTSRVVILPMLMLMFQKNLKAECRVFWSDNKGRMKCLPTSDNKGQQSKHFETTTNITGLPIGRMLRCRNSDIRYLLRPLHTSRRTRNGTATTASLASLEPRAPFSILQQHIMHIMTHSSWISSIGLCSTLWHTCWTQGGPQTQWTRSETLGAAVMSTPA